MKIKVTEEMDIVRRARFRDRISFMVTIADDFSLHSVTPVLWVGGGLVFTSRTGMWYLPDVGHFQYLYYW
jgi:hypothetical protein